MKRLIILFLLFTTFSYGQIIPNKLYQINDTVFSQLFNDKSTNASCTYTITCYDSQGNSWKKHYSWLWGWVYDEYLTIYVNGSSIGSVYANNSSTNYPISLNDSDLVQIVYRASGSDDYQNAFEVFDPWGNVVASGGNPLPSSDTWVAQFYVHCSQPPSTSSYGNDCDYTHTVCSTDTINASVSGPGNDYELDLTNCGCLYDEHQSMWIYFHAQTTGTISFTIVPNSSSDDYDFAIWGNSNCKPNGQPIRCSWAAGNGNTGIRTTSSDNSEDAAGDGWVSSINANAGDEFLMIVDNWSYSNNGFSINWSLTNGATLDCTPMPIQFISGGYNCKKHTLFWKTTSETNNEYYFIEFSKNLKDWQIIDTLKGAGTSKKFHKYEYYINKSYGYLKVSQQDYNGDKQNLFIKYFNCDDENKQKVFLYPNPSTGIVNIKGEYNTIKAFNMFGMEIRLEIVNNQIINLEKGIYVIFIDDIQKIKLFIN